MLELIGDVQLVYVEVVIMVVILVMVSIWEIIYTFNSTIIVHTSFIVWWLLLRINADYSKRKWRKVAKTTFTQS